LTVAFAHFDEPLAWLIRGLVEYGWADISRTRMVPPGYFGGMDLSLVAPSQGRNGVLLQVPAVADGNRCHEDENYTFEIMLSHNARGKVMIVRGPGCNYFEEFAYETNNPLWVAGYIHQALTEHVNNFVRWRLQGGELTWAQRQSVPPVEGEPCSATLAAWMSEHTRLNRSFDLGASQGWWVPGAVLPQGTVAQAGGAIFTGAVASMGNAADGIRHQNEGLTLLRRPALALSLMTSLNLLAAGLALLNILVTLYMFRLDRMFAIGTNMLFILLTAGVGVAAWFGVRQYRAGQGKVLPWVAIVYSGLLPICCLGGVPVAVWAGIRWMDPRVRQLRR
jgi:hypothetical protein